MGNIFGQPNPYRFREEHEAFRALLSVLDKQQRVYYLIGGQARDLFLSQKNLSPPAVTRDIDFAVMVEDVPEWNLLISELAGEGFQTTNLPYRLIWPRTKTMIDLLPFGGIADGDNIRFPKEDIEMSVAGFSEVSERLERVAVIDDGSLSIPIAPFHGIFLLKLISWSDRPEIRLKDLGDMRLMLWHYWDFVEFEAYDFHLDIFDSSIPDTTGWGARILGRHIGETIGGSPALLMRIAALIGQAIRDVDPPSPLLSGLIRRKFDDEDTIEDVQGLLSQVLLGIKDRCPG